MEQKTKERQILDSINEACYLLDKSGTVLFVNKKAEQIFGRNKNTMLNRNVWEVFPEAKETLCFDAIQINALENRRAARFEYQSAITHTWISLEAVPTDEGCLVLFHEIEELKQAQNKYQRLIDDMPDMITRWNKDLKLIFANKALETKLGIAREKLYGKNKSEMEFPDEVALPWMDSFKQAFRTGKEVTHYSSLLLKSGTVHFHSRIIPEKNKLGEVETVMCIARDISDLKEAEQELKEVNARLELKNKVHRYGEEIANIGSWTWNPVTNESLYSDNMFRLFGMQPGEVKPNFETIPPFLHPEDRAKVLEATNGVKESGEAITVEYRVIRKDGKERTFRNRLMLVRDGDPAAPIFMGITEDITEQKRTGRELQQQTEQLIENKEFIEHVTSNMSEIISVMDVPSRKLSYFNRQPVSMTGYTTEELSKMTAEERLGILIHPDDRQALQDYYNKLESLEDESLVEVEYRFRKKGGGQFWFHTKGKVFKRDEQGSPIQTLHIGNDVTERKNAEALVKEQLHFINKVTSTLPDMLSVIRLSDLAVTYANKESFELNNFSILEIKNMMTEERKKLIYPDDLPAMSLYFASFADCGEKDIRQLEYRARNNKGEWEWYRVRGKVFKRDEVGKPTHCVNIVQNIHGWKKAEEELIDLKLQQQKEILNAILIAQEQERERIGEALHNGVAQLLYGIHTLLQVVRTTDNDQIKELLNITNEAINETKKISFELIPAVLKDYGIDVALRNLLHRIAPHGPLVEFNTHKLQKRLPEKLEFAVYRIIQELLNNCIKHAKATKINVNIRQKNGELQLEVTDNGIGFDIHKIEPMDAGIGLQSIKNRVHLLEGTWEIRSSHEGTTVMISIPVS